MMDKGIDDCDPTRHQNWHIDDEPFEEDLKWIEDDPLLPKGTFVKAEHIRGIALVVRRLNPYNDDVICVMVGDEREHTIDRNYLIRIEREEFCGECGQIGCTCDGLERE